MSGRKQAGDRKQARSEGESHEGSVCFDWNKGGNGFLHTRKKNGKGAIGETRTRFWESAPSVAIQIVPNGGEMTEKDTSSLQGGNLIFDLVVMGPSPSVLG